MSLAWRSAAEVSCGLAATGPQPFAARVALIWFSRAPPWSPPSAPAGTAASIGQQLIVAAAQIRLSVEALMRLITCPPWAELQSPDLITVWTRAVRLRQEDVRITERAAC